MYHKFIFRSIMIITNRYEKNENYEFDYHNHLAIK